MEFHIVRTLNSIPIAWWKACPSLLAAETLAGLPVAGGLDLSSTTDLTPFVLVFRLPPTTQETPSVEVAELDASGAWRGTSPDKSRLLGRGPDSLRFVAANALQSSRSALGASASASRRPSLRSGDDPTQETAARLGCNLLDLVLIPIPGPSRMRVWSRIPSRDLEDLDHVEKPPSKPVR